MTKTLSIIIIVILISSCSPTRDSESVQLSERIKKIEHKEEIRNLVDTFSNLADIKDTKAQALLFTENAVVETFRNGILSSKLEGRKQIDDVFGSFLANFKTVYHMNGQHTVTIEGEKATGILYCLTVLISPDNVKTTFGIRYNDEYTLVDGKWLISRRRSNFEWQEVNSL
jgi:hypothetical protein